MKNINLLILIGLMSFLCSCVNNKDLDSSLITDNPVQINTETLIEDSGFRQLRANQNTTWEAFHENYLQVTKDYEKHAQLNSYKASLIMHQIQHTSFLANINAKNASILLTYLDDLKNFRSSYPKLNYLALKAVEPYTDENKIQSLAKISYDKGMQQQVTAKEDLYQTPESTEVETIAKDALKKSYQENYIEYLPKLKEFFISEK